MMMIKSRLTFWIVGINLFFVFGLFSFWISDNQPPYDWADGWVKPNPAYDGSQVNVCWKLRIKRFCPGMIQRQIVDAREEVHNYDPVPAADKVDVYDPFCVTFRLPKGLPQGLARYRVHATYSCNPLQFIWPLRANTPELPFTIENDKEN